MKNCANCKNKITNWNNSPPVRTCAIGRNAELNKWWADNGSKPKDLTDEMDCFQEKESPIKEMLLIMKEMDKLLGNYKNRKK